MLWQCRPTAWLWGADTVPLLLGATICPASVEITSAVHFPTKWVWLELIPVPQCFSGNNFLPQGAYRCYWAVTDGQKLRTMLSISLYLSLYLFPSLSFTISLFSISITTLSLLLAFSLSPLSLFHCLSICLSPSALVEEIYQAQRDRDQAVMARLRLANEERDEALLRAKRLQQAVAEYVLKHHNIVNHNTVNHNTPQHSKPQHSTA